MKSLSKRELLKYIIAQGSMEDVAKTLDMLMSCIVANTLLIDTILSNNIDSSILNEQKLNQLHEELADSILTELTKDKVNDNNENQNI